jgi:hypothetical protein
MKPSISEILEHCSKLSGAAAKAAFLVQYQSEPLKAILYYALDPRPVFDLPKGAPPYKVNEFPDQHGRLYVEVRKIPMFLKNGSHPNLHPIKREQLFIQLIEGIDPKDAQLLISVKDKKIPYKGITTNVVNTAFPGLIAEKE